MAEPLGCSSGGGGSETVASIIEVLAVMVRSYGSDGGGSEAAALTMEAPRLHLQ